MGQIRNSNEIIKYFNCTIMKISHKLHIKSLPKYYIKMLQKITLKYLPHMTW